MNCSPNIVVALSLLSLIAGVWFLYKTQKENLSILYKIAAWAVIIITLGNMLCCGMRCMMHCGKERNECREMNQCEMGMGMGECGMMGQGMCRMHGMSRHMMMCKEGDGDCEMGMGSCGEGRGECKEGKGSCEEEEMECSKKGEKCKGDEKGECKMKMKKDSVVIIKKK